jgi:hypothetical protein
VASGNWPIKFFDTAAHCRLTDPGSPGSQLDPAVTQRPPSASSSSCRSSRLREQHRELHRQRFLEPLSNSHTTTMTARNRNHGLMLCESLVPVMGAVRNDFGFHYNSAVVKEGSYI